jgi:16S rRNA (cytosine1402-N4)-methyltransferase
MTKNYSHQPVLLAELIQGLDVKAEGVYVDATFGRGGHSRALLNKLGPQGHLLAIDRDPTAIAYAHTHFADEPRFQIAHANFSELQDVVQQAFPDTLVDGILMDLGVSSPQLDDPERGFSFSHDGPLDMRMNTEQTLTAADWLATASQEAICDVLHDYGEERFAKRIAEAIVIRRQKGPITRTRELADCIADTLPFIEKHKHPATRSFQGIRIFINRELEGLAKALPQALALLAPGGRLAVISFHSLEDRIVKQFMRVAEGQTYPKGIPLQGYLSPPKVRTISKKIKASDSETRGNPRARSATLRIVEKI